MFKRFCKRMKNPKYRAWLLGRMAVIFALLLFVASIVVLLIAPLVSKADTVDLALEKPAVTTYPTETETAATEPPTAPQPTETEAAQATESTYTYFDCELSEDLQEFIFDLCEGTEIAPEIVIAMCWKESTYNPGAIGDNGNSYGLMQIQPRWHYERMQRLGCTDLLDPYQNITVGVDFLCELLNRYGSIDKALTAYNMGSYSGTVTNYAYAVTGKAASLGVKE